MKNPYYWTCPTCGANLDLGESCEDCKPNLIPYPYGKESNNYQAVSQPIVNNNTGGDDHVV